MKKLLMILTCFLSLSLTAQEVSAENLDNGWQLLSQKDGVNLYVKKEHCKVEPFKQDLIYVMVRVENTTNKEITTSFSIGLKYDVGCYGCNDENEASRSITVPAGATVEGDCSFKYNQLTYLISNPNHGEVRVFNGVQLVNLNNY